MLELLFFVENDDGDADNDHDDNNDDADVNDNDDADVDDNDEEVASIEAIHLSNRHASALSYFKNK